jgi:hypothetical protein
MEMNVQDPRPKPKKWQSAVFYSLAFVCLAGLIAWSFVATTRWIQAELYLGTYVRLAGKTHASLNFEKGRTHLLRPEGEKTNQSTVVNGYVYTNIPTYSKWDRLYLETYNMQMRSHLSTNRTVRGYNSKAPEDRRTP